MGNRAGTFLFLSVIMLSRGAAGFQVSNPGLLKAARSEGCTRLAPVLNRFKASKSHAPQRILGLRMMGAGSDKLGSKPKFTYLDLPLPISARGGVLRFFMLTHSIEYEENLIPRDEWTGTMKSDYIKSGKNPCGQLPVLELEGKDLGQHIATCRLLARKLETLSSDPFGDYAQDAVADEYQKWRNDFVGALFGSDEDKVAYKKSLPDWLKLFEALFGKYMHGSGPYLSESPSRKGLWGDSAIFSLLWDNMQVGFATEQELQEFPKLSAMFKAYGATEGVKSWTSARQK